MSRKGRLPIPVPAGVEVKVSKEAVSVKGPKGALEQKLIPEIHIEIESNVVHVSMNKGFEEDNHYQGLYRTLIDNLIQGVTKGFEKRLEMIGVGYRASVQGHLLDLLIGKSHPTKLEIPKGIDVKVDKNTLIILTGSDKQMLGQFAADIRSMKPPEPYQGKGIRYVGEFVRRKAGKTAAKK